MPSPCPPAGELTAFAAGDLDPGPFEAVADHLTACPACQDRLAALDARPAPVLAAVRAAAPPAPVVAAQPSGLTEEVRALLRWRLLLAGAVGTAAIALMLLPGLVAAQDEVGAAATTPVGGAVLAAYGLYCAGTAVWLKRRPGLGVGPLRRVELGHVGFNLAVGSLYRWAALTAVDARAFDSAAHRGLYVEQAALVSGLGWYFIILVYGLFIPNTARRTAAVVGAYAAAALLSLGAAAAASPAVADRLPHLLPVSVMGLLVVGSVAVFGSYKIATLQAEAVRARQLGPYTLVRRLGAGGMGEVHLAEHGLLKRPCAVKLIRPEKAGDSNLIRRFEREARATAGLTHPNTVEVFDFGRTPDGTFYYVMEYLPGPTLADLVRTHGPLPPARAVHFLRQLCGALREAHAAGLVHRDVKPGNVIVCRRGTEADVAKLLDFGLVHHADGDAGLTRDGTTLGTPDYMAPEQTTGGPVGPAGDLYSLGAVGFFLLTGRPPFRAPTVLDLLLAHRTAPPPRATDVVPDTPADLDAVLARCLAKAPADRYPDAAALDAALAACGCAGGWTAAAAAAWWRAHEAPPAVDPGATVTHVPASGAA
ncbi:MAG TPA: protein kinase [Gemmataceae bacterium]|nr:protein kinase [Gemmataceae bacterium]